jgi:hypothetical protein
VAVSAGPEDVDAGWTALRAFHTVFDIKNPYVFGISVHDESMEPIKLD